MGSLTSDELNFLVYRYLHESGELHALWTCCAHARVALPAAERLRNVAFFSARSSSAMGTRARILELSLSTHAL